LEISINGKVVKVAGGADARYVRGTVLLEDPYVETGEGTLRVHGYIETAPDKVEHCIWLAERIKVGDTLSLRIIDADRADNWVADSVEDKGYENDTRLCCSMCGTSARNAKHIFLQGVFRYARNASSNVRRF
jgi:hypothetical protein